MRSVHTKILLWGFGTLLFSLVAFIAISFYLAGRNAGRNPFSAIHAYKLHEAIQAYESGGRPALAATLAKMQTYFPAEEYVTDSRGIDLVTGVDRSGMLANSSEGSPRRLIGHSVIATADPSGRYRYLLIPKPPDFDFTAVVPYYLLILLALAGLCWLLAVNIATPIRELARAVARFGAGDLDARIVLKRRDEIGDLAGAFNQMAQRLQTLVTSERRLLQDISHELRSPLARLSFATELTKTAVDREAATARVRKEIDRLTDLVGGLIQVTRAEGEFWDRNLTNVCLDDLVRDVSENCMLEAVARNCRIRQTTPGPVHLLGDRELLRRAFENVLRNAIRYAPESTTIEVSLETRDSMGIVAVRDHGPGVPENLLSKLFTPFFRVDDSRNSATGGVGLGLAIAQRAVMLHHGQITASNAEPGLLVTVSIPVMSA